MAVNVTRRDFGAISMNVAIAASFGGTTAIAGADGSANVQLFRAIIERGFNQGDLSVADEVCAANLIEHEYLAKTQVPGPEILKDQIQTARANVAGMILTIEDLVESGNKVWARLRCNGTHARSGKLVSFDVIDICRFENGKLHEHWGIPDRFAQLHQIGALGSLLKQ